MTGARCFDPIGCFLVPPRAAHGASIALLGVAPVLLLGTQLLLPAAVWLIWRCRPLFALLTSAAAALLRLLASEFVSGVGRSLGAFLALAAALLATSLLAASIGATAAMVPALLLSAALPLTILGASFRFFATGRLVRRLGRTLRVLSGPTASTAIARPLGLRLLIRRRFLAGTLPLFVVLVVVQTENLLAHRLQAATPA